MDEFQDLCITGLAVYVDTNLFHCLVKETRDTKWMLFYSATTFSLITVDALYIRHRRHRSYQWIKITIVWPTPKPLSKYFGTILCSIDIQVDVLCFSVPLRDWYVCVSVSVCMFASLCVGLHDVSVHACLKPVVEDIATEPHTQS